MFFCINIAEVEAQLVSLQRYYINPRYSQQGLSQAYQGERSTTAELSPSGTYTQVRGRQQLLAF
jgi:hypothetical protein